MSENDLERQLVEINRKLDFVTEQLALQQKRQREAQELKEDLGRIATDVFQTAALELDEVAHHFDASDLWHLGKKLLRNVRNLARTLDQLESANDFFQDAKPIARDAFFDLLATLDELDRKGYFAFFSELAKVLDKVVTAFSVEDVRLLGENIVTILTTVRNLTQPDMLEAINNAVSVYKNLTISVDEEISYRRLFKEFRTPEMRRGLAFGIQFLKNLAATETENAKDSTLLQPNMEEVTHAS
ncbi:MAG: DUF1641 domain-containing protein [Calditrichaeota bacterium]|nr:DUF1641 domain-containing protein [Calditrichota bacterium]